MSGLPSREGWAESAWLGRPRWQTGQPGVERRFRPQDVPRPVLSERARAEAERIVARYPTRRSAMIPLLYLVQSEVGWVPRAGMEEVAEILDLTPAEVEAVASFYTMLKLLPCGRYVVSVCTNPSCALLGGRRLFELARETLGDESEQVTEDGLFTVEEEECLAACDRAPVVTVNYLYYDRVTEDGLRRMIDDVRAGSVPPAARGGVPGDLRTVSRTLAGLDPAPEAAETGTADAAEQTSEGADG
jgi:NADH-quinone oxidoreductase subunit E